MLNWMWENSDKLSDLATALTGIATVILVLVAWHQITESQRAQRRATAFEMYSAFLRYNLEHPAFLVPDLTKRDIERGVWKNDETKFAEYEVYIDLMIVTFEELLNTNDPDQDFEEYMRSYLDPHAIYFSSRRFKKYEKQLDPMFLAFLRKSYPNGNAKAAPVVKLDKVAV